jgi:hypothetical protein
MQSSFHIRTTSSGDSNETILQWRQIFLQDLIDVIQYHIMSEPSAIAVLVHQQIYRFGIMRLWSDLQPDQSVPHKVYHLDRASVSVGYSGQVTKAIPSVLVHWQ